MVGPRMHVLVRTLLADKDQYWARLAVDAAIDVDLDKLEQLYRYARER